MSQQIVSNLENGTLLISDKFDINASVNAVDATPYFNTVESEYIISFVNLQNVSQLTNFKYDTLGLTDTRFLKNYYRISRDGNAWTDWLDLKRNIDNFPTVDPRDPLYLDIKWVRGGSSQVGAIRILEYSINGTLERTMFESAGDGISTVNLTPGENTIWSAPFIYKVFDITDVEVIAPTSLTGVDIKYRFSQDNSRTWSNWEPFTKENISTTRINPIRFFQIEYSITNNTSSTVGIQDINLIGDFQNVSKDYFKTNLYGIRECCQSNLTGYTDASGNFVPANNTNGSGNGVGGGISNSGGACDTTGAGSTLPQMNDQDKANLFNPYKQNTAMDLLNKLSADAEQVFGHKVIYFVTDPDKRGQDHTMHEYQLYNVVCEGNIKVSVDGNNFPDSQIVMNQFDLSLFESMNVHITKKQFKEIFGPQRRPSKEDFLYFCDVNRMFQVDHAQQFRNFNNSAIYYKLVLKKYTQKANVKAGTQEIQNKLQQLTKNSTINELFGIENAQDKASIANKDQFAPLTKETIRLEYKATIDKELIENSSTIISKAHYDLSSVDYGQVAVKYKNFDPLLRVSDNIGYQIWFKINNYITNEVYNFMDYYDATNSLGWKVDLSNDAIQVKLNSDTYTYDLMGYPSDQNMAFEEDVWYCYVLNVDQRNRKLEHHVYKRNVDDENDAASLSSTILRKVYQGSQDITPITYQIERNVTCQILASDMSVTNIRLFMETIPANQHNKICNQYIIRDDSKYLVFADNATTRLYLPKFPLYE
jgi:hypothetical protein